MDLLEYILIWALLLTVKFVELAMSHPAFLLAIIAEISRRNLDRNTQAVVMLASDCFFFFYMLRGIFEQDSFGHQWLRYHFRVCNEFMELLTWFTWTPRIGTRLPNGWEVVAEMKESKFTPFTSQQFYPTMICDFDMLDDPFWPHHISAVYYVESHGTLANWMQMTLWQASLFSGQHKKIAQLDYSATNIYSLFAGMKSYQSSGVVFVLHRSQLIVHDTKHGKTAIYDDWYPVEWHIFRSVMITCMGRLWNTDGTSEGWRIRSINAMLTDTEARVVLTNTVRNLRQGYTTVAEEEIEFGNFDGIIPHLIRLRTGGMFCVHAQVWQPGVWNPPLTDGPTMCYNVQSGQYVYYSTLDRLIQYNPMLARYLHTVNSTPQLELARDRMPIWINDRECIQGSKDGTIYRLQFQPASMKYSAAKKIFRSTPGLRSRMTTDEFRQKTGIDRMNAHFVR